MPLMLFPSTLVSTPNANDDDDVIMNYNEKNVFSVNELFHLWNWLKVLPD